MSRGRFEAAHQTIFRPPSHSVSRDLNTPASVRIRENRCVKAANPFGVVKPSIECRRRAVYADKGAFAQAASMRALPGGDIFARDSFVPTISAR
jgi:hypothetical protein